MPLKSVTKSGSHVLRMAALMSLVLAAVKFGAFFVSGSLLALTSFFDSIGDIILSLANSFVQRQARKSPDKEHPFGHGGIEVVSALIQGTLLMTLGMAVVVEATQRMMGHGSHMFALSTEGIPVAVGILLFSALGGWVIQAYLKRSLGKITKRGNRSLTLLSDLSHYSTDAVANLLSAVGLVAVYYSGVVWLDNIFGAAGGVVLIIGGGKIIRQSTHDILNSEVAPEIQKQIVEIAKATDPSIQSIHRLRTREMGPSLFVDFHMTLPGTMTLETAHELGEVVARRIKKTIPRADVLIHLDPDTEPPDDLWSPGY